MGDGARGRATQVQGADAGVIWACAAVVSAVLFVFGLAALETLYGTTLHAQIIILGAAGVPLAGLFAGTFALALKEAAKPGGSGS